MAIFEEQELSARYAGIFIVFIFLLAYPVWLLGSRELSRGEGSYVTAAEEITSFPSEITLHAVQEPSIYPLFPMLTAGLMKCGLSMELAIRLVPVIALFALCAIVWAVCRKNAECKENGEARTVMAAAAGSVAMMSFFVVAEKVQEGYPQMLTALILFAGWQLWITLGVGEGKWNAAWISAGVFGGLAFYNGGLTALAYFLVPLIVQRRPLTIWPKLKKPGFYGAALIVFIFMLLWIIPRWFSIYPANTGLSTAAGYFSRLVMFPVTLLIGLMPWSLILWAPFCAALIPLDPARISARFHRIIFLSLLVLIWINPGSSSRDLLYLAPPVAVMAGSNYWIITRRYGHKIHYLLWVLSGALLLASAIAMAYICFPDFVETHIKMEWRILFNETQRKIAFIECAGAICAGAAAFIMSQKKCVLWMTFAILFCGIMMLYWATINPYKAQDRSKTELGDYFNNILTEKEKTNPRDTVIRKSVQGLYSECCYFDSRMKSVTPEMLAEDTEPTIYVLGTEAPSVPARNWTRIGERIYKNELRLHLYKGVLIGDDYDDYYDGK